MSHGSKEVSDYNFKTRHALFVIANVYFTVMMKTVMTFNKEYECGHDGYAVDDDDEDDDDDNEYIFTVINSQIVCHLKLAWLEFRSIFRHSLVWNNRQCRLLSHHRTLMQTFPIKIAYSVCKFLT